MRPLLPVARLQHAGARLALLALISGAAAAQQPPRFEEVVKVELVNVELWVTDRQGHPVAGLKPEDFEVRLDGEPVEISHFAEVRADAPARPAAAREPAPAHLVIFWDGQRLPAADRKSVLRALRQFVESGEVPPQRILVLHQERNLKVEAPFGSSPQELDAALGRLQQPPEGGVAADARQVLAGLQNLWARTEETAANRGLQSVVSPSPRAGLTEPGAGGGGPGVAAPSAGAGPQACRDFLDQVQPVMQELVNERRAVAMASLGGLWDTVSFLAGVPGAKTVLYLSGGLETLPGSAIAGFVRGVCPGEAMELSLEGSGSGSDLTGSLLALTRHANANRVTIYTVQEAGRRSSLMQATAQRRTELQGARAYELEQETEDRKGLLMLAEQTGGRAVLGPTRLLRELERIGGEIDSYYSLAFRPPESGAGAERRIEVTVSDGSLSVRHRRGFRGKSADERLRERLLGAVYLGLVENPLQVRLGAGAVAAAPGGRATLPVHVMVPVERLSFLPEEGGEAAWLRLKAMAVAAESGETVGDERRFRVPRPADGVEGFVDLSLELEVAAGRQTVAVALEDVASREASLVTATLDVEPPS